MFCARRLLQRLRREIEILKFMNPVKLMNHKLSTTLNLDQRWVPFFVLYFLNFRLITIRAFFVRHPSHLFSLFFLCLDLIQHTSPLTTPYDLQPPHQTLLPVLPLSPWPLSTSSTFEPHPQASASTLSRLSLL